MSYYISKTIKSTFAAARERVEAALKEQGFAVKTELNASDTFREKLGEDFKPYLILGACNPQLAFKGLTLEDKLGIMLPCNVIIIGQGADEMEIAAVDPRGMMKSIGNPDLDALADEVYSRLGKVINAL